jgi:YjjG family noncanonical pyrimidine nucleotidase
VRYATILFDLDHTLLDSDASHAAAFEITMRSGLGLDDPWPLYETFDRINQALWRRVERHELSPDDVAITRFRQLLDEIGADGDPEAMSLRFRRGLADHGELYPGARELLASLAGRVSVALVTNGIGEVQRGRIERLGLGNAFDAIAISGELGTSKPGRAIFDAVFEHLGTDGCDAVIVGDNLGSDIQGGVNAGIDTIWFNPGGVENDSDLSPSAEARSLADVGRLLHAGR